MGGVQEEAPALAVVVKGKRSKRQRVHSAPPSVIAAAAESSSAATEESAASRSGTDEAASGCVTEEEEDMALCLMLLARGGRAGSDAPDGADSAAAVKEAKFRSRRPAAGAAGEFVYECKTCNKCFPSFQALGGHRTSHKKARLTPPLPPTTTSDEKKPAAADEKPQPSPPAQATTGPTVLAIPVAPKQEVDTSAAAIPIVATSSSKQPRVHECSICSAEFASGQALGGHMRRHRPLVTASASALDDGPRKEKSLLELDLNMPAPCDDAETPATSPAALAFAVKERTPPLLFPASASASVHCHY